MINPISPKAGARPGLVQFAHNIIEIGEIYDAHPSGTFLLRAWNMPTLLDWVIMSGLGLVWAGGMYCMARAYSLAQASVAAPFEYVSLPINIIVGLDLLAGNPDVGDIGRCLFDAV